MKNKVHIDYGSNPDLAEAFSRKKPGEKCTFEVTIQVDKVDEKSVTGTIERVALESSGDKEEKETEPTADEPMMMEMSVGTMGSVKAGGGY